MSDRADDTVLVLGVGNPLMGDEGIGPRVIEHLLSTYAFPDEVEVVDAGTMGFSILNLFRDRDAVIVVDAVQGTGQEPGTVVSLDAESMSPNQVMHSLHDARLIDVLQAATLMGVEPEVVCIGVEVAEIVHWQTELTPVVSASIPYAAEAVVELLAHRDLVAKRLTETAEGTTTRAGAGSLDDPAGGAPDTTRIMRGLRTKDDIAGG